MSTVTLALGDTAQQGASRMHSTLKKAAGPLLSMIALIALWQTASFFTPLIPAPLEVVQQLAADSASYPTNIAVTMGTAGQGYLWGNGIAIGLALLTLPFPRVQALLERVAVSAIALPLIAVAPILAIAFAGNIPGIILSAQAVVFTTLISCILGLSNVDQSALDLVHAAGGSRWTAIWKVRLPAAIPALVVGLQIAAPSAVLGAIIGEYMGGSQGLGVAMIQAQGAFDVPRAWAIAIVTSLLAALVFLLIPFLVRVTLPWVGQANTSIAPRAVLRAGPRASRPIAVARTLLSILITTLVVFGLWWVFAAIVPGGQAVARGPFEVIAYFADPASTMISQSGQQQSALTALFVALGQTGIDAGVGFVVGTLLSVLMAVVVYESRTIESLIMPVSLALRSVPIVAAMPLLALLFGRGILAVTVLITMMTFFPTLVNLLLAMRSAPRGALDLLNVAGATRAQRLGKLLLPYATPALFASIKIALPLSVGAAMVAEWLATGTGLGAAMTVAATMSNYYFVWGGVAAVLLISLLLYQLASYWERKVSARLA